jgi:choline kinase
LQDFLKENGFNDYLLIKNPEYEKGNLYSLHAALPEVKGDFFVFNADHYYSFENYQKIFSADGGDHITVFCDQDRVLQPDDMKMETLSLRAPQSGAWQSVFKKMSKQMPDSQVDEIKNRNRIDFG